MNEDNRVDSKLLRVGILGPLLTYTHQAAEKRYGDTAEIVPYATIDEVFARVEAGEVDEGVVPEENVIDGTVRATIDGYYNRKVYMVGKVAIPISHYIGVPEEGSIESVEEVLTKAEAFSQCSQWIEANLPYAKLTPANSTADAARIVNEQGNPKQAAIGPEMAIREYGLKTLAQNVGNVSYNKTLFGIIKGGLLSPELMPEPTGDDETTIVIHPNQDYSGQLVSYLDVFRNRDVNLTRIESRPGIMSRTPSDSRGDRMGYLLTLSMKGHYLDDKVKGAVMDIVTNTALFEGTALKVVGSHERVELYENST